MWFSGGRVFHRFELSVVHLLTLVSIVEPRNLQRAFNNSISAAYIFGDSTVDPGNNNFVTTPFRSNFPPYGRDFAGGIPTGRFTDGAYIGIKEYVPPYLEPTLNLEELKSGVSFASAGSGLDPLTPQLLSVISMEKQLEYFKEYKLRMEAAIGKEGTKSLISKAAFLISVGTNDIVINYYGTPFRRKTYDITSYLHFLLQNIEQFIQALMKEGAQLITVVGMPPLGCLPIVITATSGGEAVGRRPCLDPLSSIALDYNQKLQNIMALNMRNSGAILIYADIYKPLNDLIHNASHFGFEVVNAGCCGSGLVEVTFLCNEKSIVCEKPSKYVFFDSVHPTEAAYSYIFQTFRPLIDSTIKKYGL
ncbi:GDSL-like Lipase/Acylhydrolase superfamily protein [Perilla frutescens var. hirtella]|uniref:GDSL-like Lipase/Acylhydrolase superfamily protein n=1 Tax=Perilla frutescens var. hirtella TaxID=608512 RepID=A0AAD4JHM5_PERFH|nr:GDSL-like Lipase/Acylhydrolase superfamily protein [Perilla frutescens var. hirtella]